MVYDQQHELSAADEVYNLDPIRILHDRLMPKSLSNDLAIDLDSNTLQRQLEVFEKPFERKFARYFARFAV